MRFDDEDDELDEWGRRRPGVGRVVAVAIPVALLTTTLLHLAVVRQGGAGQVTVPAVVGLAEKEARLAAGAATLRLEVRGSVDDPVVAPGGVARQQPLAGSKVERGTTLRVVLSRGLAQVVVPALAGLPRQAAEDQLRKVGLRPGALRTRAVPGSPAGRVIASEPPAGTRLAPDSAVNLVVTDQQPPGGG